MKELKTAGIEGCKPISYWIDLVVTKDDSGIYHARGGPREAIFSGSGNTHDEAIGSWFRQNRETVGLLVSYVMDGEFFSSTYYGVSRGRPGLGRNELKALVDFESPPTAEDSDE